MSKKFEFMRSPAESFSGGTIRRANKQSFPELKGFALQSLVLEKGAVRHPHIHTNAAQMDFVVSGTARVGITGPGYSEIHDVGPGDVTFIPPGHLHWIENSGDGQLHFLLMLTNEEADTLELSAMVNSVPPAVAAFGKS